jgi:hypothetical protein
MPQPTRPVQCTCVLECTPVPVKWGDELRAVAQGTGSLSLRARGVSESGGLPSAVPTKGRPWHAWIPIPRQEATWKQKQNT